MYYGENYDFKELYFIHGKLIIELLYKQRNLVMNIILELIMHKTLV